MSPTCALLKWHPGAYMSVAGLFSVGVHVDVVGSCSLGAHTGATGNWCGYRCIGVGHCGADARIVWRTMVLGHMCWPLWC